MKRPLVTARDLEGGALPPAGAILTPLARDLLRRRGQAGAALGTDPSATSVQRLVVANWKSQKTVAEARRYAEAFRRAHAPRPGLPLAVICPPSVALHPLHEALAGAALVGAQDISPHPEGPHTGEVAGRHLREAGASFAIVGHSERRAGGEDDALVRRKALAALAAGLRPILCVGETAAERAAGRAGLVVRDQLAAVLAGLDPQGLGRLVVAYEPRWAIGAGVTPTAAEVSEMLLHVRSVLEGGGASEAARAVPVLYGGSVSQKNAAALLHVPGCAGALVGGASLEPEAFLAILAA